MFGFDLRQAQVAEGEKSLSSCTCIQSPLFGLERPLTFKQCHETSFVSRYLVSDLLSFDSIEIRCRKSEPLHANSFQLVIDASLYLSKFSI